MPPYPSDDLAAKLHLSVFSPIGYQASSCGYCKGEDTGGSYYVSTPRLTPQDYQALVDRGWRRSGTLLYKPDNRRSCCPQHTIRIPAADFKTRRDQRSALHRWNRHVLGDKYAKEAARLHPASKEDKKRNHNDFDLESTIHKAETTNVPTPPEPDHRFEVTLEEDSFTQEKFQLFRHYQETVHHEDASPTGFRRFLCDSPLVRATLAPSRPGGPPRRLGSYHQLYRLDGRLVAVGVLDLLPHGVSGVYFLYHADFARHAMGRLGALREACLAREGGYGNYYMGYYIHGCAKMRYKAEYGPQEYLDFTRGMEWKPLDEEALKGIEDGARNDGDETHGEGKQREAGEVSTPRDAQDSGVSVLEMSVPGVMTAAEVEEQIDLDGVNIQLSKDMIVKTSDLVGWDVSSLTDPRGIRGVVAEFAACAGPEVVRGERSALRFYR